MHPDRIETLKSDLHEADIEVILDVVYNHTAEADRGGPTYSFRGIDNSTYYLLTPDMQEYRNDTGTGNVLRTANRHTRKLVMDSLRYWVQEMHVDGFRFDLASIFTRNDDGSINLVDPPIVLRHLLGECRPREDYDLPDGVTILERVEQSGLRGRGGAAFPTAAKWRVARQTSAPDRCVVANGDEGDPGAYIDRLLLEEAPHSILAGMLACARAIDAHVGVVFVRGEYPRARAAMRRAVATDSSTDAPWFRWLNDAVTPKANRTSSRPVWSSRS